jgi:hypothetical protein
MNNYEIIILYVIIGLIVLIVGNIYENKRP